MKIQKAISWGTKAISKLVVQNRVQVHFLPVYENAKSFLDWFVRFWDSYFFKKVGRTDDGVARSAKLMITDLQSACGAWTNKNCFDEAAKKKWCLTFGARSMGIPASSYLHGHWPCDHLWRSWSKEGAMGRFQCSLLLREALRAVSRLPGKLPRVNFSISGTSWALATRQYRSHACPLGFDPSGGQARHICEHNFLILIFSCNDDVSKMRICGAAFWEHSMRHP